jgi:DinB superfamily
MKTIKFFLFTVAIVSMSFSRPDNSLSDAERKYALNLLQETKENLLTKVKGLTAEQLNFKADEASWSVAECVEHIAISENNIFGFAQMGLKEPADPSKRTEVKMTDEDIVKMISDRSTKRKTQEAFEPTGKFGSFDATLSEFKTKRDNCISYIKSTSDDLRNHYNDFPFGKLDTYQTILFMAAHSRRHTDQIDEIINNPNFPKKGK